MPTICPQAENTRPRPSPGGADTPTDFGERRRLEAACNVLRTLILYDLFGCPVRLDELPQRTIGGLPDEWVADPQAMIEVDPVLARHVRIARGYVFLRAARPHFDRWVEAERTRRKCIRRYEKWVRLFCRIPFVRMIAVTGSLSFPMPPHEPDCDLFVVTARNRLWIVVALSRLLFLRILPMLRLVKYGEICPNYSIEDRVDVASSEELFDTMQIAAMNPVLGREIYENLVTRHRGLRRHFPHWEPPAPLFDRTFGSPPYRVRRGLEGVGCPLPLDRLNRWLYRVLSRRFASGRPEAPVGGKTERFRRKPLNAWIRRSFSVENSCYRLSLRECKVHGNGKLALLARYDEALRNHPAAALVDLAGEGKKA